MSVLCPPGPVGEIPDCCRIRRRVSRADTSHVVRQGGDRMRAKLGKTWKHMLYTSVTLATLLLAAGAHYKPNH